MCCQASGVGWAMSFRRSRREIMGRVELDSWQGSCQPNDDGNSQRTRMVAMCGIVGYTGEHQAASILVAGLRRLEYRGYDSAGLATIDRDHLIVRKRAGRVRILE